MNIRPVYESDAAVGNYRLTALSALKLNKSEIEIRSDIKSPIAFKVYGSNYRDFLFLKRNTIFPNRPEEDNLSITTEDLQVPLRAHSAGRFLLIISMGAFFAYVIGPLSPIINPPRHIERVIFSILIFMLIYSLIRVLKKKEA